MSFMSSGALDDEDGALAAEHAHAHIPGGNACVGEALALGLHAAGFALQST
jgi:hypothetical protein